MSQDYWNYIFIGLSFVLYIGIAVRSRAGSTKEYYTAGGGVSPLANGMATAADWMSAATFISMAGTIAISGYDASRFLMGWTGGFVLLTILMVPFLRKFGKATVPDFIGDRYYSKLARAVAVLCAIFICMTYIMGQMRGVGGCFFSALRHWHSCRGGYWCGYRFCLRRYGGHERHYLHPGGSVLRDGICLHYSSDLHRYCSNR